jgi:uroporphyrin-III C-methyltransferase
MTVDSDKTEAEPPTPAPTPRRGGGGVLAALALLLALAGLGGAGYLYFELVHRAPDDAAARQVANLAAEVSRLEQRLALEADRQAAELQALREHQEAVRAGSEAALREALASIARQAPPTAGEWRRAEIQYLLRIANHRLLMERDVPGALGLLQAADALLVELDDFALHPVRAELADEIAALQAVQGADLQGLFLRLETIKNEIVQLPLRAPAFAPAATPAAEPADGTLWQAAARQLGDYVRVRRLDAGSQPLLAPEEAAHLELNLRLMLERAQLAAVRGEQLVFEGSLATADGWVRKHMDLEQEPVPRLLGELDALRRVELQQPLPDISGSLNTLRDVLRNPT